MSLPLPERYRPRRLDDVIGQKETIKGLTNVLSKKAIPKTWLFTGPAGTGKTTLAEILAHRFAGESWSPANIIYVNAAVDTGAEETRSTVNKAMFKALGPSIVKTMIVDECHNLSQKAWDALLVTTERPPDHVYWIFCSTNPAKVPETIKTRCTKYTLKPVNEDEIYELLVKVAEKEKFTVPPEVLEIIATECNGSPREALNNLEKCAHVTKVSEARELLRLAANLKGPVDIARYLVDKVPHSWADYIKLVKSLENVEAESVRIVIVSYLTTVLLNTNSEKEVRNLLSMIECFSESYNPSNKLAPLLLSIGAAIGLDQQ